jgi:hypothetical protein
MCRPANSLARFSHLPFPNTLGCYQIRSFFYPLWTPVSWKLRWNGDGRTAYIIRQIHTSVTYLQKKQGRPMGTWTPRARSNRYYSKSGGLGEGWRKFITARAKFVENFWENCVACGNLTLLTPHSKLYQWRHSSPYGLAPQAAARLARPSTRP